MSERIKEKLGRERFKERYETLQPWIEAAKAKKPIEEYLKREGSNPLAKEVMYIPSEREL